MCRRQFVTHWADCKKSRIAPFNAIIISISIIIIIIIIIIIVIIICVKLCMVIVTLVKSLGLENYWNTWKNFCQ